MLSKRQLLSPATLTFRWLPTCRMFYWVLEKNSSRITNVCTTLDPFPEVRHGLDLPRISTTPVGPGQIFGSRLTCGETEASEQQSPDRPTPPTADPSVLPGPHTGPLRPAKQTDGVHTLRNTYEIHAGGPMH